MNETTDKAGHKICGDCGVYSHSHGAACTLNDILTEQVRKVIAHGMASRRDAKSTAILVMAVIDDFLVDHEIQVIGGEGQLSRVIG